MTPLLCWSSSLTWKDLESIEVEGIGLVLAQTAGGLFLRCRADPSLCLARIRKVDDSTNSSNYMSNFDG